MQKLSRLSQVVLDGYPNSAVLLHAAFPNIHWKMRLHEIELDKRRRLREWADTITGSQCQIEGDWRESPFIRNAAVPPDEAGGCDA